MSPAQLFVYGTLRHDHPEHRTFCRGVTGWRRARVRGRLWRIPEGYLLLEVPPPMILLVATADPVADEKRRADRRVPAGEPVDWPWIEGELLDFRDAAEAWPPIDGWEGFVPGQECVYPRCLAPIEVAEGDCWSAKLAWVYATIKVPAGSAAV